MNPLLPLYVLAAVLGLAVGSFLNVVIYRVPRQESLLFPNSHCPQCQTEIKARHNVPVLGWLALRGRCAHCRESISVRYPLVEAATAAAFVAITVRFGFAAELPAYLYLAAVAIALAMIDFDVKRLPDSLVLPSYLIGAALLIPAGSFRGSEWPLARAVLAMAALWTFFYLLAWAYPNGMGFGDVKLAGLIGLFLGYVGWGTVLIGGLGGFVLGSVVGLTLMAVRRANRKTAIPFGPFMLTAALLALFVAGPIVTWYGTLLGPA